MPKAGPAETLRDRREIVVVLRLLVATHGDLIYGEVVDVQTEQGRRFAVWPELEPTVQAVLRGVLRRPLNNSTDDEPVSPH